jgi:hypothetical protein
MILSKIGDRNFVVNSLSNFILSKIGQEHSTIIKVVDLGNFFVVKGKTDCKSILNLNEVVSEFNEKFEEFSEFLKITNTIDLIEYDCDLEEVKNLTITLHNSDKIDFHYKQIESFKLSEKSNDYDFFVKELDNKQMVYCSQFPNGYSLSQGRLLYYYIKKIFYSIPSTYPITTLTFTIDENKNEEDYLEVFDNFSGHNDETLKSAILDCIDFTKKQVESEMKKVDCNFDILNPLEEYPYLKEGKKIIII